MDGPNAGALPDFQSLSLHSKAAAYNVQQWKVVPDKTALCRLNAAITVTLQHICLWGVVSPVGRVGAVQHVGPLAKHKPHLRSDVPIRNDHNSAAKGR